MMNLAIKLKDSFNRRCEDFLKIEKLYVATYLDPGFLLNLYRTKQQKLLVLKKLIL